MIRQSIHSVRLPHGTIYLMRKKLLRLGTMYVCVHACILINFCCVIIKVTEYELWGYYFWRKSKVVSQRQLSRLVFKTFLNVPKCTGGFYCIQGMYSNSNFNQTRFFSWQRFSHVHLVHLTFIACFQILFQLIKLLFWKNDLGILKYSIGDCLSLTSDPL